MAKATRPSKDQVKFLNDQAKHTGFSLDELGRILSISGNATGFELLTIDRPNEELNFKIHIHIRGKTKFTGGRSQFVEFIEKNWASQIKHQLDKGQ